MLVVDGPASSPGINKFVIKTKMEKNSKKRGLKANAHNMFIGNINVTTVKCDAKLTQVMCGSRDLRHEICGLTETHKIGSGVIDTWPQNADLDGRILVFSGFKKKAEAGVALSLSRNCILEEYLVIQEGRILYCRVIWLGVRMQIWIVYAPTNTRKPSSKSEFYQNLQKSMKEQTKKFKNWPKLVLGDLNATFGPDAPFSEFVGKNPDKYPTTDNGYRLNEFLLDERLYALNTLFECKERHRVTFKLGRTRKRLDYIIGDKWFKMNCINARAYPEQSSIFESNHRLMMAEFQLPSKRQRIQFFKKIEPKERPLLTTLRDDPEVVQRYSEHLDANLPEISENDENRYTIDEIEKTLRTCIIDASAATIPRRKKDQIDWATTEFSDLLKKYKNTKKRAQKHKVGKQLKKLRIKLRNEFYQKRAKLMNTAHEMRMIEEEFRIAKTAKMVNKSTKTNCPTPKLVDKFTNHFATKPEPPALSLHLLELKNLLPHMQNSKIATTTPSLGEVQQQLEILKNGRCQGVDGFSAEHLKYADSWKLDRLMYILIKKVWEGLEVPEIWIQSKLVPIFKQKGSQQDADNYRGLMFNAITNKVLILILLDRIRAHYEASMLPFQFGFRSNKATTDGIFIARQMINKYQGEIWGCFIDVKAAYDWVPRETLWRILRMRMGAENDKIVDIFQLLYEKTTAKISGSKSVIDVKIGLRQGGAESCVLFNYWLDTVFRIILHKISLKYPNGTGIEHSYNISNQCTDRAQVHRSGRQNGTTSTSFTKYCDDVFISAKSREELQGMLEIVNEVFVDFGIRMSETKTKTMTWHTSDLIKTTDSLVKINNIDIENVSEFRYLGHLLTDDPKNLKFLQQQINSAYGKWHEFKDVFSDKRINLHCRVKMAESIIRSRLVYGVQTENLKYFQKQQLDMIWIRLLRRMVRGGFQRVGLLPIATTTILSTDGAVPESPSDNGRSRPEADDSSEEENAYAYVYNKEKILNLCKSQNASTFCLIQHCKFMGHVARLPNDTHQKQWLFTNLPGTRCQWKPLAKELNIDEFQLQASLYDKEKLNSLLYAD